MSPDSLNQYGQAFHGFFEDAHPPMMSIVLWMIMKLGGDIGILILFQCLFAVFGLRTLLWLCLRFFSDSIISIQSNGIIATIITLLFLIPFLSPFMFFSVIFWKDAWLTILLLWLTAYLLWIFLHLNSLVKRNFLIHLLLLSVISSLVVIIRHNAIVIIPVICLAIAVLMKLKLDSKVLFIIATSFLPLFLALALNPFINSFFKVDDVKTGNLVVANDLTTMLRLFPELEAEYPVTALHRKKPRESPKALVIELGNENRDLQNEHTKAIYSHPVKFLSAKLYLFWEMLSPHNWWQQKLAYDVIANPYGLKTNENYSATRYKLNALSIETGNQWYLIWISGLHIVWLVLNVLAVIYLSFRIFTKRNEKIIFSFILFLIPLSYYFSYVLAATTPNYRFMYPSMLLMQVFIISLLLSKIMLTIKTR
jgi:hypothetical protein